MLKQKSNLFLTLFGFVDMLAISGACLIAWGARVLYFNEPLPTAWESYFKDPLIVYAVPIVILTMYLSKLYRPRRDRTLWGEFGQVLRASLISIAMIVLAIWAVGGNHLTSGLQPPPEVTYPGWRLATDPFRFQLVLLLAILPFLIGVYRLLLRLSLRAARKRGWNARHAAVIGVGRLGQITTRTLGRNSWTGISVQYFISHHEQTNRVSCLGLPVKGGVREMESILDQHPVDAIYLAIPAAMSAQLPDILKRLERFAVDVRIIPDVHPRYLPQNMAVSELEGMPVLSYRESPMAGVGGVLKRAVDIVGALTAMLVFMPIMLVIAILIRTTTDGPVLFKQRRVSLGGDVFWIYKFRTMNTNADADGDQKWTSRDDQRIHRVGKWLRRTSLDELPQLLNVLRGDMALVGPRPERPELIDRFREDWRGYMIRQHVKAGMTGWAQINGLRGDTSLRKRLQYDLFYIRNWSIWLDIRILFVTVFRGFVHRNAM
ncbi:MAG: undecaprenyl-phosphate glucose phosphotransferase [Phycisphaerales bacterium]|nr:undecaprenyl-phosphate glucose phosphotransferase [Phycisphaerales bacterium]